MKRKITIGIIAHVDSGKTTLSESILYNSGVIKNIGRVDFGSSFLDTDNLEKQRGITIYSREARFQYGSKSFIIVDTPGHSDFSAEMERSLSIIDYAVLIISITDGVQPYTHTLWNLLKRYGIPTFVFVNKTDMPNIGEEAFSVILKKELSETIVPFFENEDVTVLDERISLINEQLLDTYLSKGHIDKGILSDYVSSGKLVPCFFGSALKNKGIDFLLGNIALLTKEKEIVSSDFGAKVYKIEHINENNGITRLTHLRLTGGCLNVRDSISYRNEKGEEKTEKINQIRLYSGEKYVQVDSVADGDVCSVTGLSETYSGQGLGVEKDIHPSIIPVVKYNMRLKNGIDPRVAYQQLKSLGEDEPELNIRWNSDSKEIELYFMGLVQIEILERKIRDRFNIDVEIENGKIIYKETIIGSVEGVGHFEPLRHYAEVHLIIEAGETGSGIIIENRCSDDLQDNWQLNIISHLKNHIHKGVLTGSQLTDVKIILVSGKAHEKHTDSGDFREASKRAVRQGLMKAKSVLLEPYYRFALSIPSSCIGKAINDLQLKHCSFDITANENERAVIEGCGPVLLLQDYYNDVQSYTSGAGSISFCFDSYKPCHNAEEVVSSTVYDPESDIEETPDSVFCEHGAGYIVKWSEVEGKMHLPSCLSSKENRRELYNHSYSFNDEKELEKFINTHLGEIRRKVYSESKVMTGDKEKQKKKYDKSLLVVDGYNMIFSWDYLKDMAQTRLELAREKLIEIIKNYSAFSENDIILVFDAYLVKDGAERHYKENRVEIVYTKENETADTYIERLIYELGPDYSVRVVTSDTLIRRSSVHAGVFKLSSEEFIDEMIQTGERIREMIDEYNKK